MKNIIYTMSFILSLVIAPNLYAHYGHHKSHRYYDSHHDFKHELKATVRKQHRRIAKGIDRGLLTQREVRKLEKKQHKFFRMKNQFWSDRHLTRAERHLLTNRLERISQKIYDFKHNDRYRRNHYGHNDYAFNYDGNKQGRVSYGNREHTKNYRNKRNH